jgi:hypothetical protein
MASVETANVEMFHHEKGRRRGDGTDLRLTARVACLLLAKVIPRYLQTLHDSAVPEMRRKSRVAAEQGVYKGYRRMG